MHPELIICTCRTAVPCRVPHGVWLGASRILMAVQEVGRPYPHVCQHVLRRDCAACREFDNDRRPPLHEAVGWN